MLNETQWDYHMEAQRQAWEVDMSKNEFDQDWLVAYIAKRRAEKDPLFPWPDDIADPEPESKLQAKVIRYCKENGWPCFHDRSRKINEAGWPDCFIFLPNGHVVLIELKGVGGRMRSEQKALHLALRWLKHDVHVSRSFKKVVEIIERELEPGPKIGTGDKG